MTCKEFFNQEKFKENKQLLQNILLSAPANMVTLVTEQ